MFKIEDYLTLEEKAVAYGICQKQKFERNTNKVLQKARAGRIVYSKLMDSFIKVPKYPGNWVRPTVEKSEKNSD